MIIYLVISKITLKVLMGDKQLLPPKKVFILRTYLSPPPPQKAPHFCPMDSEFHKLRPGYYDHNNDKISLSPTTVIVRRKYY